MGNVAVLGLGSMGFRMAKNLLSAGHRVAVYNRTAERARPLEAEGAICADSPRGAAENSDIVISVVTDNDSSRAVWLADETGAVHGLRDGTIAVETSTLTPEWVQELGKKLTDHGAEFLDAPVVGSRPQADAGALVYLIGGLGGTLEKAREVLAANAATIHHIGPIGSGTVMKLAVNALFGVQVAAFSEIFGMVRKSGIEGDKAVELLNSMAITSPAMKIMGGLIAARKFAPLFPINLVEKDFGYVIDSAERVGAPVPTAKAVRDVYASAKSAGHGEDNITGVAQLFD